MDKIDPKQVDEKTFLVLADFVQEKFPDVAYFDLLIPALRYFAQVMEEANVEFKAERIYH